MTTRTRTRTGMALAALLSIMLLAGPAQAETVAIGDQVSVVPSSVARPARGMTMKTVEARFGAPQSRHEAVGKPPISRWDYPDFSVFFEKDRVIDAVVAPGAADASSGATSPQAAPSAAP